MRVSIYAPGLVLGQLQILSLLGGTDERRRFRVRWGCCGREATLSVRELRAVREMRARSGGTRGGLACLGCIAKAHRERLAAEDAAAEAAERAEQLALAEAERMAEMAADRPLKPRGHRQAGAPQGMQENPPWTTTPARLPRGVLAAAVAWPRVGVGS